MRYDSLSVFLVSLYLVVIASGVVTAVSKLAVLTYHKVRLGITALKTPQLKRATLTKKTSAGSADDAPTVSAAAPAAVPASGAGIAGKETESVGAVDVSSGVGKSGAAAADHGGSLALVERKTDAAEGFTLENLRGKSTTDRKTRKEEYPPVEPNNPAGEKSSEADEVSPAKIEIEALSSPAAEDIDQSLTETQPPYPPPVAEGSDGAQGADSYSDYDFTTDDLCGMPPTSTVQAPEEPTESLGTEANGVQGPSICAAGVPTSPAT